MSPKDNRVCHFAHLIRTKLLMLRASLHYQKIKQKQLLSKLRCHFVEEGTRWEWGGALKIDR